MASLKRILAMAAVAATTLAAAAQEVLIKGTVSDNTGELILGAAVMEKGTTNGTVTDFDGAYSLKVSSAQATLTVSYLGFETQDVELGGRTSVDVVLQEKNDVLNEVVVTGYTVQRKADLTGSIVAVSAKDIATSPASDPMVALQGRVPGMNVGVDGSPLASGSIRIRGIGSINSSQDPLLIIDGMPSNQSINSLNSEDIESIQVLKDAASASIYGSRAANGVIIITTKKGKKSDKLNVDVSAGVTAHFYTNQSKMDLLDTKGYITAMVQAAVNDGINPVDYTGKYGIDLKSQGGTPISVWNPNTNQTENYTIGGLYDGYINQKKTMRFSDTDWLDEISRTGITQHYNVSFSGASDLQSSMVSFGFKRTDGIMKYSYFENFSVRANTDWKLADFLTVGENLAVTYTTQADCAPMENALKIAPIIPVYENDGKTFAGPVGSMADRQNPMREMYYNKDNHLDYWRIFGNAYIDLKPVKGLTLRSNYGIDFKTSFINSLSKTFHSDIINRDIASTRLGNTNELNFTWSNTAHYAHEIDVNRFDVLVGTEITKQNIVDWSGYSEEYALEDVDYMWPNASTGKQQVYGAQFGYRLASFFGKANYNYNDLVLASFTLRHDGSSRFGKDSRWGTFPAVSLGFRASELIDADWLSDLKVRGSWGQNGNQAIDNNAQFGLYVKDYGQDRVTSTAYDLNLQGSGFFPSGYRATSTANPNLKWETAEQWNFGIDFTMLDGDIYGNLDVFKKDIKDMLISPAYLGAVGEGGDSWQNGPSMRNSGMELQVGYRTKFANELTIDVNGNLSFYRNKVTYMPSTSKGAYAHTDTEDLVQSGKSYGSVVGYIADGLFQTKEEAEKSGQHNARMGGIRYKDLDGNGTIDGRDQTWILDPVPDFSYGLNISLGYKGWDAQVFFQGVAGQDVYNNQKFQTDFWSITDSGSNKGTRLLGAWNTNNTGSDIPMLSTTNSADEGRCSTYFVENGSYLKMRTCQVGYTLPKETAAKAKMSNARVYLSGQNLFTIKSSSLTCSDPENANWAYPLSASVSVGMQITF